jgi:succinyl-CoA synthetase beta subunit
MLIHEYQAKEFLKQLGINVPEGQLAENPRKAGELARKLSGKVVLKAQVLSGGRGRAGGIILARGPEEAEEAARKLIGKKLITNQTGNNGLTVRKILVEKALEIRREIYLGLAVDRKNEQLVAIAGKLGGVEIEDLSASKPEWIKKEYFLPDRELSPSQKHTLDSFLELGEDVNKAFVEYLEKLSGFFVANDLKLLEINPLILTAANDLIAADARMDFDDCGLCRHPEIAALEDLSDESEQEAEARKHKLNYLKMNGNIGCLVNGAGLAMATMDIIKYFGGQPANFLDIGGGVTEESVSKAFEILVQDSQVTSALINIFGGIVRCDLVARGIVNSARSLSLQKPVVVRLEGTNAEEGKKTLEDSGVPFHFAPNFEEAARLAVHLSRC